jgi:menaquinone-dependent protoporphyrinogen oxidase
MKVLVAYASKYGATEGIAQRIGERLRSSGLEVDVSRCKDVDAASRYDAYVVGSAAYIGKWRKDARKFVQRNAEELDAYPVWLFSSGPVGTATVDAEGRDVLAEAAPKEFAEFDGLIHPRGRQVFFGAFHPDKIRGGDRLATWLPAVKDLLPAGDFRDWDAIDAWASSIADELEATVDRS